MKIPKELVEAVAAAIDPEAWEVLNDGRDKLPDSLWFIRRNFARDRAVLAIRIVYSYLKDHENDNPTISKKDPA